MKYPKKLIEVALPLDDINRACAYEKMPGIGPHPRGIHHWWARRPLAAARAVLFAQMVNDPGGERGWGAYPGQTRETAQIEREKLFNIMRDLVKWGNTNNEDVLKKARAEIQKSWEQTCKITGEDPNRLPPFLDPFAGGGSIPLEAQRLGLEGHASDLNPVAVMICKATIEIPPKFAGLKPVGPIPVTDKQKKMKVTQDWSGTKGLAEDIRRYGNWMRTEAFKQIGHLYPQVQLPKENGGGKANVIAWLWARTVPSPNPAFKGVHVPLVKSFWLCNKKGKETWVEPVIAQDGMSYEFEVRKGRGGPTIDGTVNRSGATCILSKSAMPFPYVRGEGQAGRMSHRLMVIVAEGPRGRVYLNPTDEMESIARSVTPSWKPDSMIPTKDKAFCTPNYGLKNIGDLFTPRQLVALTTFSDLVLEARNKVIADAKSAGRSDDGMGLNDGGSGATAYGDAVAVYLAFGVDRSADFNNTITGWRAGNEKIMNMFNRQAIPMVWDFGEANILENVVGGFVTNIEYQAKCLAFTATNQTGFALQAEVANEPILCGSIISTDPPYYDNIGYGDLSDFFYVWMRKSLKSVFPDLFTTIKVPKKRELIASKYRHGSEENAQEFFLSSMTKALANIHNAAMNSTPVTIYYAFKQTDGDDLNATSTGWDTFLSSVIYSGFEVTGTWPLRTEQSSRMVSMGQNALASSIVLVCRKRPSDASAISRKQFLREIDDTLPEALETMIGGKIGVSPIAPVDLAQAAIGPGMAVYSQYSAVLNADGTPMSVREALVQINRSIDEYFTKTEGLMDSDTRFCIGWFEQYGFKQGPFGEADVLARAKVTSVEGVASCGVVESGAGKVRLLRFDEYADKWDPTSDRKLSIWEALHHLIHALKTSESKTGTLLSKMPDKTESVRQLAYRLYTYCERKGWAEEARQYNELITSWGGVMAESIKQKDATIQPDFQWK